MKIGIISFGHADVILPLFKSLKNKNINVELIFCFALNRKSESILNFEDKKINTGFLTENKINEIVPLEIKNYLEGINSLNFFIFYNLKLRSFKNFILSFKLKKILKNYDIIHFNGTNGVLPLLMLLFRKKKLIFTIHDISSHSGEKTRFNFAEKLNKIIIKSRYALIVHNKNHYNLLTNSYKELKQKFHFVPFGVLDIYRQYYNNNNNYEVFNSDILFFGRISPYKGIEYLIDSIKELKSKRINFKAIIAGKGDAYFNNFDFSELNILFINRYISTYELVNLIINTKIVVCPYTDATQSGVVMTAYAFNKPVIATNIGGLPEVVFDGITGKVVPPKDPKALASAIYELLNSPEKLNKMSKNIERIFSKGEYSWDNIAEKMVEVYKSVLKK